MKHDFAAKHVPDIPDSATIIRPRGRPLPGMIIELSGLMAVMAQGKMTTSVSPKLRV